MSEDKFREDDRVVSSVVAPPLVPLSKNDLFPHSGGINIDLLRDHMSKEGRLSLEAAREILQRATRLLRAEPNLLKLFSPITGMSDCN